MSQNDSSVQFIVDGDASGGRYHFRDRNDPDEVRWLTSQHAQEYFALGDIFGSGPHICLWSQSGDEDWFRQPPYAEGGGASFGEHPTLSVTEFYVTPFDRLIQDSPEESVVSTLSPGTLIGFILQIVDLDEEGPRAEAVHSIVGQDYWSDPRNADTFARGLLVGPGGELPDSAVGSLTWGRIKATFVR